MKRFLSKNQLLLLRIFYTNPHRSFYMQEIGRILEKKPCVFQRTLNALVEEGLLKSEYRAGARFFQVDTLYPLYSEIKRIIAKSVGVGDALREITNRLEEVKLALIYGSFAKGSERMDSDVDILVVGRPQLEVRLLKEIGQLEKKIQREINYKLYSKSEYRKKRAEADPFLQEVLTDQIILLKGNPRAI